MTVVGSGVREQDDRRSLVARSLQWPGCTGLWEPPPPAMTFTPCAVPFHSALGVRGRGLMGPTKYSRSDLSLF